MARSAILKIDMTSFFYAEGGPIWIKFGRLVQNDMSTALMWLKSKPDVEIQYVTPVYSYVKRQFIYQIVQFLPCKMFVCPSVCPSHGGIMSEWLGISSDYSSYCIAIFRW